MKDLASLNRLSLSVVAWLALASQSLSQPFVKINASLPRDSPGAATWADLDGDGDMDLLLADLVAVNTVESRLYRNNGNGAFALVDLSATRHSYFGYQNFWGDDNRDGRLDLLLTSHAVGNAERRTTHPLSHWMGAGRSEGEGVPKSEVVFARVLKVLLARRMASRILTDAATLN